MSSAGRCETRTPDAPFIIRGSYFEERRCADVVERDGLRMTFSSRHRPLEAYFAVLKEAGFVVEPLVEAGDSTDPPADRWQRIPLFLHFRAVKRCRWRGDQGARVRSRAPVATREATDSVPLGLAGRTIARCWL